jgi:hypothetical protein
MVMLTDIVIIEIDEITFAGDRTFLQIYTKYVMDIAMATSTKVHFCVFIEPKIEISPIIKFIEEYNFQSLVSGLELIIGNTEWE